MGKQPEAIHTAHIVLPWPARPLWQNYSGHWSKVADAKRRARSDAKGLALEAGLKRMPKGEGWEYHLSFDFCPPNLIKRDIQNMPATVKASIDGIADALGVDDSTFKPDFPSEFGTVADDGGSVLVVVRAIPARAVGEG